MHFVKNKNFGGKKIQKPLFLFLFFFSSTFLYTPHWTSRVNSKPFDPTTALSSGATSAWSASFLCTFHRPFCQNSGLSLLLDSRIVLGGPPLRRIINRECAPFFCFFFLFLTSISLLLFIRDCSRLKNETRRGEQKRNNTRN